MFRTTNLDSLSAAIHGEIRSATPSENLLKRLRKVGHRHGRKGVDPQVVRALIEDAVNVASSSLAQEYLEQLDAATRRLAAAREQLTRMQTILSDRPTSRAEPPPVGPPPGAASVEGEDDASDDDASTRRSGPDLSESLRRLRDRQAQEDRDRRAAAEEAERAGIRDSLGSIQTGIADAELEIAGLCRRSRQRVESCHRTGELLWKKYRFGYAEGAGRAGGVELAGLPDETISFQFPDVLANCEGGPNPETGTGSGDDGAESGSPPPSITDERLSRGDEGSTHGAA